MLNEEQIKQLITNSDIKDLQKIELVQQFIYDKKSVEVKINTPNNMSHGMLLEMAFNVSLSFYQDKFNENKDGG